METRRLQYFVEIADAGSINRAAAHLGMAQPALSQQLAILEGELKARLLDRSPAGVTLTDAGRRLYARAQIILRQVGGLRLDLAGVDASPAGLVSVGLPPSQGLSLGLPLIERTLRDHPKVRLQVLEDGAAALAALLRRGLLDMAVSPVRIPDPEIESEPLLHEGLFLMSSMASPAPPADLSGLAALPWIVTGSPNAIRAQLNAVFALAELEPDIVAEINSLPLVARAVEAGLGVTLLPRAAVRERLDARRIRASAFGPAPLNRTVYLCTRRDESPIAAVSAVQALVRAIAATLNATPEAGAIASTCTSPNEEVLADVRAPV